MGKFIKGEIVVVPFPFSEPMKTNVFIGCLTKTYRNS